MDYEKIYFSIVRNRKINKFDGYTEKHHILPRSLGGSDENSNLVNLSAREHYICHLLLTKMYKKHSFEYNKMLHAFMMMCNVNSSNQERNYKVNSKLYEKYKLEFKSLMSKRQSGEKNITYGTRWIHSLDERRSKRITESLSTPRGWKDGRIINFDFLDKHCEKCDIHLNCKSPNELKRFCDICRKEKNIKKTKDTTSKKCVCSNIEFKSLSDASKELGISIQLIRYRIKSNNFNDYYYM